ncbi:MAG TPA: hypothetical protein VMB02_10755 [Candidatus Aquilonibacter sp.]|nr:hypothetical protein [Candidatus Aquilonibacter sp.]
MPKSFSACAILIALAAAVFCAPRAAAASPDQGKALVYVQGPEHPARKVPCDRACLKGFVDKYFAALSSRCPCTLALAPDVKYTENGEVVAPGEGIWKTFSGIGKYHIYLEDPANSEAGYYGDFTEFNGALFGMMAMRLKIKDQRITEIEVIVDREQLRPTGGLGMNTAGVMTPRMIDEIHPKPFASPDPVLLQALTPATRTPRAQMTAALDRYFEGYAQSKSSLVPFADRCSRRENGILTANNASGPVIDPAQPGFAAYGGTCAQELDAGFFSALAKPRDHRNLVVDEQQGLVLSLTLFDNEGDIRSVPVPQVGEVKVPTAFLRPITYFKPQLFKIEKGKILAIEGLSWALPFGMTSGWGD